MTWQASPWQSSLQAAFTTIWGSGVSPIPSLDLNFTLGSLDPRITYTGASLATLTDATGAIAYKPHNLALYSDDLTNGWNGATATAAPGTSRTGGNSTRVQLLSGEARQRNTSPGSTYAITSSVGCWLKSNTGSTQTVRLKNTHAGVLDYFSPDLTVTTTWQFFSFTQAFTAAAGGGTVLVGVTTNVAGTAADILVGEFQHNLGPLQPYYPTTGSAYFGPRFTYDPVTHAALGLLIEEQRTNLLTYSEQFDNAAWPLSGSTVTANATTGPDGNATADKLVESAGAGVHLFNRAGATVSLASAMSVYAKAAERTQIALQLGADVGYYNLSTGAVISGANASIVSVGNGWYRCILTGTPVNTNSLIYLASGGAASYTGDGTSGVYLWGAQLEAGAFATSYIPTTSASVTRAADSATMTGSNFSSWFNATQGTFVPETRRASATVYGGIMATDNGGGYSGGAGMLVRFNNAGSVEAGGNSSAVSRTGLNAVGSLDKVAYNYSVGGSNPMNISANGGAVGNLATTDYTGIGVARLIIGGGPNGALNAPISRLRYYPTALTNAQLQALTT